MAFVAGDVQQELHLTVDLPLPHGSLRVRASSAAVERTALENLLRSFIQSLSIKKR